MATGFFFVAVTASIIPAMGILWWMLHRYEGYFEDARVFFSLAVGFFVGLAATAFEFLAFPFHSPGFVEAMGPGTSFLMFVGGYAFFETGTKTIALGLEKFRGRKDTPYYGAALGLGFGAMAALLFVALNLNASNTLDAPYTTASFLAMASVPLGGVLVHGATGVYVGRGSANGELWKGWGQGALLQMPLLGAYWLFWPSIGHGDVIVLFPTVLALGYGIGLIALAQTRVLDVIVPPEIKAKVAAQRRRELRRGAGAAGAAGAAGTGGVASDLASEVAEPLEVTSGPIEVVDEEE